MTGKKKLYKAILHGKAVHKLDHIHDGLKMGHKVTIPEISVTDWFNLTSEKMNLMKKG